jgi:glycine betaine/proline transport system ATP-binding protein
MGLSGSGKSTLLRCVAGLAPIDHGSLSIDGEDLARIKPKRLIELRRSKMGMVFQNFALLPHLTALQNVAFPLRVQGVARQDRETRAMEMIELGGLSGREGRLPHELSGGQQQRVGIARSLATKPPLWFLDEPFSALDPIIRYEMQSELLRLQKLLGKTVLFITHDLDEAIRIADRIAIMRDGRIVQIDTAEGLVLHPADAEVARFLDRIPRQKILSVSAVMRSPDSTEAVADGVSLTPRDRIADIGKLVLNTEQPVGVRDADGMLVGVVHKRDLVEIIL